MEMELVNIMNITRVCIQKAFPSLSVLTTTVDPD